MVHWEYFGLCESSFACIAFASIEANIQSLVGYVESTLGYIESTLGYIRSTLENSGSTLGHIWSTFSILDKVLVFGVLLIYWISCLYIMACRECFGVYCISEYFGAYKEYF